MKRARDIAIAAVLIGVSAWLAHMHVVSQSYHPIVRFAAPDGLVYTTVQDAKAERQACGAANDRFLAPVKQGCKECRVLIARCERELHGFELAVHDGSQLAHHVVRGPGMRMAIMGPESSARASCELIAAQVLRSGLRWAGCVAPT